MAELFGSLDDSIWTELKSSALSAALDATSSGNTCVI